MQREAGPHRRPGAAGGTGEGPAQFRAQAWGAAVEGLLQLQGRIVRAGAQVVEEGLEAQFQAATGGRITIKPRTEPQLPPSGMAGQVLTPLPHQLGVIPGAAPVVTSGPERQDRTRSPRPAVRLKGSAAAG